jgi:hypothetical protein
MTCLLLFLKFDFCWGLSCAFFTIEMFFSLQGWGA